MIDYLDIIGVLRQGSGTVGSADIHSSLALLFRDNQGLKRGPATGTRGRSYCVRIITGVSGASLIISATMPNVRMTTVSIDILKLFLTRASRSLDACDTGLSIVGAPGATITGASGAALDTGTIDARRTGWYFRMGSSAILKTPRETS